MPARKGRQGEHAAPLCTVNPEAAQRLSSTGLRDEETGLEGSRLAQKCPQVVWATLSGIILHSAEIALCAKDNPPGKQGRLEVRLLFLLLQVSVGGIPQVYSQGE